MDIRGKKYDYKSNGKHSKKSGNYEVAWPPDPGIDFPDIYRKPKDEAPELVTGGGLSKNLDTLVA